MAADMTELDKVTEMSEAEEASHLVIPQSSRKIAIGDSLSRKDQIEFQRRQNGSNTIEIGNSREFSNHRDKEDNEYIESLATKTFKTSVAPLGHIFQV